MDCARVLLNHLNALVPCVFKLLTFGRVLEALRQMLGLLGMAGLGLKDLVYGAKAIGVQVVGLA